MTTFSPRASSTGAGVLALFLAVGTCMAQDTPTTAAQHFETLDTNQDGLVSKDEYESSGLFAELDGNSDNRVTPEELEAIFGPQEDGMPSPADRIRVADSNDDGELSEEEIRRNAEMRFAWLDRNNDGNLDLAEMKSGFGVPAVPR